MTEEPKVQPPTPASGGGGSEPPPPFEPDEDLITDLERGRDHDLIARYAGSLPCVYPDGYLEGLREEWP